jgi:hypothetical protein
LKRYCVVAVEVVEVVVIISTEEVVLVDARYLKYQLLERL